MKALNLSFKSFMTGALLVLPLLVCSCSKKAEVSVTPLQDQGRIVYMTNCISCHNTDPRLPGSIGPEIVGSSIELITSKVLSKSYPMGYTPKRNTHLMPALPFLEKDIKALHAYLANFMSR